MLTEGEQNEFNEYGFIRVSSAFPADDANQMEERVWQLLAEKFEVLKDNPRTWRLRLTSSLQELKAEPLFQKIGSEKTLSCIDSILGQGCWRKPRNWGQFLVTFPSKEIWVVPSQTWHTDFGFAIPPPKVFGLLVFSFLSRVGEQGGGTAVISGSHRLVHRFVEQQPPENLSKMKKVRKAFFESDPWLRDLCANTEKDPQARNVRFMEANHKISGIPLRVAELVGDPGDIVLGHPWLMHTSALNAGKRPRMMCIQRIDGLLRRD